MSKGRRKQRDGIQDYANWTQHQYDPGYYSRVGIPSFLRGRRLKGRGYALLGAGLAVLILLLVLAAVTIPTGGWAATLPQVLTAGLIFLLSLTFLVGFVVLPLLARRRPQRGRTARQGKHRP